MSAKEEQKAKETLVADQLADFRKRVVRGEDVSDDELRDAIHKLQTFRSTTAKAAGAKATKSATKKMTKDEAKDLLGDLL